MSMKKPAFWWVLAVALGTICWMGLSQPYHPKRTPHKIQSVNHLDHVEFVEPLSRPSPNR